MGLDAESIGVDAVRRAVRERLAARGLDDEQAYWDQINDSEQELQELIESIVIPETWFFRDPEAFATLVRMVREEWLPKHPEGGVRILSLPCSTGEEPFSIAMALLDSGLPPSRFHIEAVDISARAIARAELGVYGKNSFRARDLGFRERYFEPTEGGYRLSDAVRRRVHFRRGNLLEAAGLHPAREYDAIFCRNVLIYFDRATQGRAIEVLGRLMMTSGILFVGPSETGLLLDHGFASSGIPLAFAFRRAGTAPPRTRRLTRARPPTLPPALTPKFAHRKAPKAPAVAPAQPGPSGKADGASEYWMDRARDMANRGKLVEALRCCEENLRSEPPSAEALYLIGLLHDAAGRERDAADHYRKALYLDPHHLEALAHLAVVLQKEGDERGAKRLLERASRESRREARNGGR
jgi:chemotaxis protein methyltransferase WspC